MSSINSSARQAPAWFGPAMVFAGGICIGFAPIGLRLGLEELGPQAIAFWRYVFALPVLFLILLLTQKRLPGRPNRFIIIAGICFATEIGLWHWSLTFTTVSNATFIVSLGNLCAGLTAWIFLKIRPTIFWGIAIVLAIIGAAALTLGGPQDPVVDHAISDGNANAVLDIILKYKGELLAFAAAILVSGYIVASNVARRSIGGIEAIFWLTFVEIIVAAMLVLAFRESFMPATMAGFVVPLFLALVVQVGGQGLIVLGLGHTPASIAGVLLVVQPVVAAAISWQLFNEPLSAMQAGGAVLILVAIVISQRGKPRSNSDSASKPSQDSLKASSN